MSWVLHSRATLLRITVYPQRMEPEEVWTEGKCPPEAIGTFLRPILILNTLLKWAKLVLGWRSFLWEAMCYRLYLQCFALQKWELPTCFFTSSCFGWDSSRKVYYNTMKALEFLLIPGQVPTEMDCFLVQTKKIPA